MYATLPRRFIQNAELDTVRKLRAKGGKSREAHRKYQQKEADAQHSQNQQALFEEMKIAFEQISLVFLLLPRKLDAEFQFLDIGCCPGGFSSYILSRCPLAIGTGISLDIKLGGHALFLEEEYQNRFHLSWNDITYYQLGPTFVDDSRLSPFPFPPNSDGFELVILDAHPLRSRKNSDRLLISQLILGMWTVCSSGTIVLKLSTPDRYVTAQILYMFDILSADLRTWKPTNIHAPRSTFYLVARGVGYGHHSARYFTILGQMRELWHKLTFGGEGGGERRMKEDDLNFIIGWEGLQGYKSRLNTLCAHLWAVEAKSLQGWHDAIEKGF